LGKNVGIAVDLGNFVKPMEIIISIILMEINK